MRNKTGNDILKELKNILQYVGETRELLKDLENCVIISKDRLIDLGEITVSDMKKSTLINYKSQLHNKISIKKQISQEGEYIQHSKEEINNEVKDRLSMLLNGLYLVKPKE